MPWPGHYRVTAAVAGGPPAPNASLRLTAQLEAMWIDTPALEFPPVAAVAATLEADGDPRSARRAHLHVVLSLTSRRPDDRIDSPMMARHLRAALATVSQPPYA